MNENEVYGETDPETQEDELRPADAGRPEEGQEQPAARLEGYSLELLTAILDP